MNGDRFACGCPHSDRTSLERGEGIAGKGIAGERGGARALAFAAAGARHESVL